VKVEAGDVSIAYVASSTPFAVIEHGDEVLEAAMVRRDFSLLRQRCLGQQQQQNNLSS
jgi:hypothetical protein